MESPEVRERIEKAMAYVARREEELAGALKTDRLLDADPYANVGKLKELRKIRSILERR